MTATTARSELLDSMYHLLSIYLGDECPEDENWEDFDPDIDRIRTEVGDLLEGETQQIATMPTVPQRFVVEVEFLSGGVRFAAETHAVDAVDWTAAKRAAFRQADDSIYDNDRIPDLTRRAIDRTTGDPAPVR